MSIRQRAVLLITTTLAWVTPTFLAMRCMPSGLWSPSAIQRWKPKARTYKSQYIVFWGGYGSVLVLLFVVLLGLQVRLTRDAAASSTS